MNFSVLFNANFLRLKAFAALTDLQTNNNYKDENQIKEIHKMIIGLTKRA